MFTLVAQQDVTTLTLDECIAMAMEKNIDLKQTRNGEFIARANRFQAMMNFLPTVNAGINYDYFFGNFFDQTAARQVSETTNSSNPFVSSSVTLFGGFANQYTLKRNIQQQQSAQAATRSTEMSVEATIIDAYLNAVIGKENLKMVEGRVSLFESQLEREKKRMSVGVGNPESVYNFRSQLANERLNLTTAENVVASAMLALVQAMQLDPSKQYDIATVQMEDERELEQLASFSTVLSDVLAQHPTLTMAEADRKVAFYALKESSAARFPTITARGTIGSYYSSNGALNPETGMSEPDATFVDQMGYNQFEYLNFSLNIPILNRFQTSRDVQVNKIGVLNADLDYENSKNNVTNIVQRAYLDMLNAQTSYRSALENVEAQRATFEFMKKTI